MPCQHTWHETVFVQTLESHWILKIIKIFRCESPRKMFWCKTLEKSWKMRCSRPGILPRTVSDLKQQAKVFFLFFLWIHSNDSFLPSRSYSHLLLYKSHCFWHCIKLTNLSCCFCVKICSGCQMNWFASALFECGKTLTWCFFGPGKQFWNVCTNLM